VLLHEGLIMPLHHVYLYLEGVSIMKKNYFHIIFAILFTANMSAKAADCSIPLENPEQDIFLGDTHYHPFVCSQPFQGVWSGFGLTESNWGGGLGWNDVCNINKPLNRALSALWLLRNSPPNPTSSMTDTSGGFLRQAYNYTVRTIEKLEPRCGFDENSPIARTVDESPVINPPDVSFDENRIELYDAFFDLSVPERASTIVHEARHTRGNSHVVCSEIFNSCRRGNSCDEEWADSGAYTYEVVYLSQFVSKGTNTTTAMKNRAREVANEILTTAYCKETDFRI
jgi:hypothetical protein